MAELARPLVFSTIKIHADNTKLEQDENGYYKVILGAINSFNGSGEFYVSEGVSDLIENQSSVLNRRLKAGYLKGEVGHPNLEPGMTKAQYFSRNFKIEPTNVSHHIKEVMLVPTNEPCGIPGGGNIILVEGWLKPSGPKGDSLKKALDNPDENVAFSIRSFTQDVIVNGINRKKIVQIVTWDWVIEPGIKYANKFDKLGGKISVESLDICTYTLEELTSTEGVIAECYGCSLESANEREWAQELITSVGQARSSVIYKW